MPDPGNHAVVMDDVKTAVREDLGRLLNCPPDQVDLGRRITELPGMDSLQLVNAILGIEERWSIELAEDDLFDVSTGEDLCLLVTRCMAAHSGDE